MGLLISYRGGDEGLASAVERAGPGTLSPAWLLSAPFLGPVPLAVWAESALRRHRGGGAGAPVGNSRGCQAAKRKNHRT